MNDTQKMIEDLIDKAENSNDINAAINLSILYRDGIIDEIEPDAQKAAYWKYLAYRLEDESDNFWNPTVEDKIEKWTKAALEENDVQSMLNLYNIYSEGVEGELVADEKTAWYWRRMFNDNDGNYQRGIQELRAKNYQDAFPYFAQAAAMGHTEAMLELGRLYLKGAVFQVNHYSAKDMIELFEKVHKNDPKSLKMLADMYYYGTGVEKNHKLARHWAEKSAALGWVPAMLDLARNSGDDAEVKLFMLKAASLGSDEAMMELVEIYHKEGDEVEKNKWLEKVLSTDNARLMEKVGWTYYHGDVVAEDNEAALSWFIKAAEHGNFMVMNTLANIYAEGLILQKNTERAGYWQERRDSFFIDYHKLNTFHTKEENFNLARHWLKKAAENEDIDATFYLGLLHEWDLQSEQLEKSAFIWFDNPVHLDADFFDEGFYLKKEDHNRLHEDGDFFYNDIHLKKEAYTWYLKAAEYGDKIAMYRLGDFYLKGIGVEKNVDQSVYWKDKALSDEFDDINSDYDHAVEIAAAYHFGQGVKTDIATAAKFSEVSVKLYDSTTSLNQLIEIYANTTPDQMLENYWKGRYFYKRGFCKEAIKCFTAACELGHAESCSRIEIIESDEAYNELAADEETATANFQLNDGTDRNPSAQFERFLQFVIDNFEEEIENSEVVNKIIKKNSEDEKFAAARKYNRLKNYKDWYYSTHADTARKTYFIEKIAAALAINLLP